MRLFFDLETNGLLPELTKIHSLCMLDPDSGVRYSCYPGPTCPAWTGQWRMLSIEDGLKLLSEAEEIIGHNIIKFDIPAIQKLFPEWKPKGKITDTLVISKLIWTDLKDKDFSLRRKRGDKAFPGRLIGWPSLEAWGYRLGLHKGDYASDMKALGLDPWKSWNIPMQEYCEQDIEVTATQLLKPVLAKTYPCTIEEVRHHKQKEARIIDTLEPVMNQHRLVFSDEVVQNDYESAQEYGTEEAIQYMLFYQMTRITRERGALAHDDRLDVLSIAVAYWLDQMDQDAKSQIDRRKEELQDQMYRDFMENAGLSANSLSNRWIQRF